MNQKSCSKGDVRTLSVRHPNQGLQHVQAISVQNYITWRHNILVITMQWHQYRYQLAIIPQSVIQFPLQPSAGPDFASLSALLKQPVLALVVDTQVASRPDKNHQYTTCTA